MASGGGTSFIASVQPRVNRLSSIALSGLPCPMKKAGINSPPASRSSAGAWDAAWSVAAPAAPRAPRNVLRSIAVAPMR